MIRSSLSHRPGQCQYEAAIFYGLYNGCQRILSDYRDQGKRAIYIDLGYWGRRKRTRWDGFHKLALNSRHPTDYFQRIRHGSDRFRTHDLAIAPWRKGGRHILLVGMSAKAAAAEGFRPEEWERETIAKLRQLTDRPIHYRPKPNWDGARPIEGARFSPHGSLAEALVDCHALVAHHSNCAVDALLAGVPCICPEGAASVLSGQALDQIEDPPMPDGREQWAWDLAYTQWSMAEMEMGLAYRYLLREGLLG